MRFDQNMLLNKILSLMFVKIDSFPEIPEVKFRYLSFPNISFPIVFIGSTYS